MIAAVGSLARAFWAALHGALPSYANSTFTAASATGSADGSTGNTLTLTLEDTADAIMPNAAVTFVVGDGVVSASQSTVTVNPSSIIATSGTATLTFTAKNAAGVALPNIQAGRIVWASTGSTNTFGTPTATDKNGESTVTFSSTTAQSKTISVTVDGTPITATVAVAVTGGSVTTYATNTFESGTIGANWSNPWGTDIDFPNDPTPRATGKVCRIQYPGTVERGIISSLIPAQTYGSELWCRASFYQLNSGGNYNANHNRKLLDWQGTATRMTLHRRDSVLRLSVVSRMSGVETEEIAETTGISVPDDTWIQFDVRTVMNSADNVRDGIVQVFINGSSTASYERTTGIGWITANGGAQTSLADFLIGFQLTIDSGDPSYTDTRYWDTVSFSDGRLP